MTEKHSLEYIREQVENEGHILLSNRYDNSHTNLRMLSPEGTEFRMRWSSFQQGKRCPQRKQRQGYETRKYPYDFIKKMVNKQGFVLLTKRYRNAHSYLKMRCEHGHEFKRLWDDFYNRGAGCPECQRLGYIIKRKPF